MNPDDPSPFRRFLLSPPGWPLGVATAGAAGLSLFAASWPTPDETWGWFAVLAWVAVFGAWAIRGLAARAVRWERRPLSMNGAGSLRWAILPAVLLATTLASAGGLPAAVRFRLSRPALERAARAALARRPGPAFPVGRVGLYPRCRVEAHGDTAFVSFPTDPPSDADPDGYAYCPVGPPSGWHRCRPLAGPWYTWGESVTLPRHDGP